MNKNSFDLSTQVSSNAPIELAETLRARLSLFPETANSERETAARLKHFLTEFKPTRFVDHVGGYGVIAEWNSGKKGPTIMVRACMDAAAEGHTYGHDAEMAAVAGLAPLIQENMPKTGALVLVFQPASTTGTGAHAVFSDDKFRPFKPDWIIGFEPIPGEEMGTVVFREGAMTTASKGLTIKLHGKESDISSALGAVHPLKGVIRLSEQILDLSVDEKFEQFVQTNVAHIRLGEKVFHTSPRYAELSATVRARKKRELDKMAKRIVDYAQIAGQIHELGVDVTWHDEFVAVQNGEGSARIIEQWRKATEHPVRLLDEPLYWSDDFQHYLKGLNGVFIGIGAGHDAEPRGSEGFDLPEAWTGQTHQILWSMVQDSFKRLSSS